MNYFWRVRDIALQNIRRPELSLVGCFHYGNIGDLAIGRAVKDIASAKSISTGYQLLRRSWMIEDMHPEYKKMVVCGGGLGTNGFFDELKSSQETRYSIIGLSLWYNLNFDIKVKEALKKAEYLTVRNKRDKKYLSQKGIESEFIPDTSFALNFRNSDTKDRVGLNVQKGHLKKYGKEYKNKYIKIFRRVANNYLNRGVEVVHFPFAKEDQIFAERVFRDMNVRKLRYWPSSPLRIGTDFVKKMYKKVSSCKCFLGTRLHSNIFCLKSGVPLFSIRYAPKCEYLFEDLGLSKKYQISRDEVLHKVDKTVDIFSSFEGAALNPKEIVDIEESVSKNIDYAIEGIL